MLSGQSGGYVRLQAGSTQYVAVASQVSPSMVLGGDQLTLASYEPTSR